MMAPLPINGSASVELFTFKGDQIKDVKVKLSSDIPTNYDPEIREHIANVQFGIFYTFLSDEEGLAEIGRIFRAGMSFAQRNMMPPPPPDSKGPKDDPPPDLPQDGEGIKDMVDKLIDGDT